jgi:hypothetical protein
MPFVQRSGEYDITLCMAAYDESGKAEIFMDIERVRRGHLQARLELCGARQVLIHSFPANDPNRLAGKFLGRVMKIMGLPCKRSYQRGYTNTIFPENDFNPDENTIYDELKGLQKTQADDEVCICVLCILLNLTSPYPQPMMAGAPAQDPALLLCGLQSDNDALYERLATRDAEHAAKVAALEAKHAAALAAANKTATTLHETVRMQQVNYVECQRQQELWQKRQREEHAAKIASAIEKAKEQWAVRGMIRVNEHRARIEALEAELAEERRRPLGTAEALGVELKAVQQQLVAEKAMSGRYFEQLCDMDARLAGEVIEDLQERVERAEEDRRLGWVRCNILQKHTDEAKKEKKELEDVLRDKERELWVMNNELTNTKIRLACRTQQLTRDGLGPVFHEEGRVLVRCELCRECAEDPIAHVAVAHCTNKLDRLVMACPLGCGCVIFSDVGKRTIPKSEIDEHVQTERCRVRLELVEKARVECAQYLVGRVAMNE